MAKEYLEPGAQVIIVAQVVKNGDQEIIVPGKEKTGIVRTDTQVEATRRLGEDKKQKKYRGRKVWNTHGKFSLYSGGEPNGSYVDPIIATNSLAPKNESSRRA